MRLGIHVPNFDMPGGPAAIAPELARVGVAAESAGAQWLSFMDHFFQIPPRGEADQPMLEGYTSLGFLAAHTSQIRLGLLVTGVTYRHPGLLAKIVSTLDVLSGGRATLGFGAAWYEREHDGLGVPFPPLAERFERLEEALQICLQMWDQDNDGAYEGTHYRLAETLSVPATVQQPRPPILIAGGGEKKTLRLVAKYGDGCNLFFDTPEAVSRKLDILREHCDAVGREYDDIQKTMIYNVGLPGDDFVDTMAAYARLGIDMVMVAPPGDEPAQWIERVCAPLVPQLGELSGVRD